jgi:hypothetical protein
MPNPVTENELIRRALESALSVLNPIGGFLRRPLLEPEERLLDDVRETIRAALRAVKGRDESH